MAPSTRTALVLAVSAAVLAACGEADSELDTPPPPEPDLEALRLAPGDRLEDHVATGKATCIVFLRQGAAVPGLDLAELGRRDGLAVRTISIEDWATSPFRERYDVQSVPWLVLFDEKGRQVAAGYDRTVLDRLEGIP